MADGELAKGSLWLGFVILQMFYMHQKGRNTLMERGKPQKAQYGLFMVTPYVIKIESTFGKVKHFKAFEHLTLSSICKAE